MISSEVWDSLSERERGWLQQAADESAVYQRELWAVKTKESLANVQAAGVEIVDCDPREFQAACASIKASLIGTPLEPWLKRVMDRN